MVDCGNYQIKFKYIQVVNKEKVNRLQANRNVCKQERMIRGGGGGGTSIQK